MGGAFATLGRCLLGYGDPMSDAADPEIWAVVPLDGRGGLVHERLHRLPLYVSAVATLARVVPELVVRAEPADLTRVYDELGAAEVVTPVLDPAAWWAGLHGGSPRPLLIHDPLCPLVPEDLIRTMLEHAADDRSWAAVRPVTDTVKTATSSRITGTIDRGGLVVVSSPVVVSAAVMTQALADDDPPPVHDPATLLAWLRVRGPVETLSAPSLGRRVDDASSVQLLECMDELSHQLRQGRRVAAVSGGPGPTPHAPA